MYSKKEKQRDVKLGVISVLDNLNATSRYHGRTAGDIAKFSDEALGDIGGSLEKREIAPVLVQLKKQGIVKMDPAPGEDRYILAKGYDQAREEIWGVNPKYGLLKRVLGSVFVLFGLGVIVLSGLSATGNAVLSGTSLPDMGLILSFILGIIGLGLLVKE